MFGIRSAGARARALTRKKSPPRFGRESLGSDGVAAAVPDSPRRCSSRWPSNDGRLVKLTLVITL